MKFSVSFTTALVLLLIHNSTAKPSYLLLDILERLAKRNTMRYSAYPWYQNLYYNPYGYGYRSRTLINSGIASGSYINGYSGGYGMKYNANICGVQGSSGDGNAGQRDLSFGGCGQNTLQQPEQQLYYSYKK